MSRTNQSPGFLHHSLLIITTKLCGEVGFTSHLAGEAASVRLLQRSLLVLARLGLKEPKHDRLADRLECVSRSKHETGKRTIARRSHRTPILQLRSDHLNHQLYIRACRSLHQECI